MPFTLAHETWFHESMAAMNRSFAFESLTLALLAGAVLATVGIRLAARVKPGVGVPCSRGSSCSCRSRSASTWPCR